MEVTGELRLIVAVSVGSGTRIDGESGRSATGATNVRDVVGPDIMQSNITLGSLHFVVTFSVDDQVSAQNS